MKIVCAEYDFLNAQFRTDVREYFADVITEQSL